VLTYPPPAPFATALTTPSGLKLPQTIAHRGYKAAYPENTLAGFKAAVDVGAHALETDIHLSKDKVVVLSHVSHCHRALLIDRRLTFQDATLQRCFGLPTKIADCDWDYLSGLETVAEPRQHMPRLVDLLAYLVEPGNEDIWILLDIKVCSPRPR
jgi:phosphatidylglycerol phospholipase C